MMTKGSFFGSTPLWGGNFNPPESRQMVYSFTVFGILLSLNMIIDRIELKPLIFLRNAVSWMGKYSLYIFLFHSALLGLLNQSSIPVLCTGHMWIKRFVYMAVIIVISIADGIIIERFLKHGREDFEKILNWIKK